MYNTRKLCILLYCLFIVAITSKSQTITGLQGGINISSLAGPKSFEENKFRFGTSFYAFLDFPLGNFSILSLESGAAISQQGMSHIKYIDNIGYRTKLTVKNKLNYIFMPVYLREDLTDFYTKIGPYVGYLFSAESFIHEEDIQSFKTIRDSSYYNNVFVNNLKKYDMGLSFGCGYVHFFQPGPRRHRGRGRSRLTPVITIDLRYNIGLLKIGYDQGLPNSNLRNQTFTIGVTITSVRN